MKRIFLVIVIVMHGCVKSNDAYKNVLDFDFNKSQITNIKTFIDNVQLVNLEENSECLIGKVKKMVIHDNKIFILDSRQQALFIYSLNGKYLSKIHSIGKGPGEYLTLDDFCISTERDEILLLSNGRNLSFYSIDGKFKNKTTTGGIVCNHFEYLQNNKVLLFVEVGDYKFYTLNLQNNKIIDKKIKNENFLYQTGFGHKYSPFMKNDSNEIYFTDIYSYNILKLNSRNSPVDYSLDFGEKQFDLNKISKKGAEYFKKSYLDIIKSGNHVVNIFYFFETPTYFITSFVYKTKTHTLFSDKNSNELFLIEDYNFPNVRYYKDNTLYTLFEPMSYDKYTSLSLSDICSGETTNIENDNPILLIYNFKK